MQPTRGNTEEETAHRNRNPNERSDTRRDRRHRFTILREIGERVSSAFGRGSIRFVPRETRLEDAHLFSNVAEERRSLGGSGRRHRDLPLVVLFLVELPLLSLPLGKTLILAPLELHEREKKQRRF